MPDEDEIILIIGDKKNNIVSKKKILEVEGTSPKVVLPVIQVVAEGPQGPPGDCGDCSGGIQGPITAADIDSKSSISGQVLMSNGNGGAFWGTVTGGGVLPLEIDSFGPSTVYERGQVINSITFIWAYNNSDLSPDTSQTLNNGVGSLPLSARSFNFTSPLSTTTVFTISASDSQRGSASRNTTISFNWRVFWGVTTSSVLTSSEIVLGSSTLTNTRKRDITYDATGGRYFWYAFPAALGNLSTVNTKINGLTFSDWSDGAGGASTSGYTTLVDTVYLSGELYNVYRSFNLQNGSEINLEYR